MWKAWEAIFLSIVCESLPFILLGVLISSLIQELVSQDRMLRLIPKNRAIAVVVTALLGFVLPVCDCGTIPVARSLMKKGVPLAAAISFTLAAPVVNPLTMTATYVAFGMDPTMMWTRTLVTLGIAIGIGWSIHFFAPKQENSRARRFSFPLPLIEMASTSQDTTKDAPPKRSVFRVLGGVVEHTILEFFEVGGFVVFSAAVAAMMQTFGSASVLVKVSTHPVWSVVAMMLLAILLSLCSEADAFVARSLAGLTTNGGLLAFLVVGQMLDLRNLFLLPRVFPRWVVTQTFILVTLLSLYVGVYFNAFL